MTPFWRDRSVLVTGAAGLLGSAAVQALVEREADVVCLVRDRVPQSELFRTGLADRVRIVPGDVTEAPLVERVLGEYEIDTVLHLAAQTVVGVAARNPVSTWESNVRGTWTVLEACRRSPRVRQIVVASSDKAYGEPARLPYREGDALRGRFPYDASKAAADLIAQSYAASFGLPVAITRCGNFFGPGDLNWSRLVPGTIRSVLRGRRPDIRSDGRSKRDYLYVADGALACLAVAEGLARNPKLVGHAFNFSAGRPQVTLDLVRRILRLMGSRLRPIVRNEASGEIRHQVLSSEKARRLLGWRPAFALDEALGRTIAWYRGHFAAP